jgi:hypothetical protein
MQLKLGLDDLLDIRIIIDYQNMPDFRRHRLSLLHSFAR